jgi:hypothetical protein
VSQLEFILSLTTLLLILVMRGKIAQQLNDSLDLSFKIRSKWISYLITLIFAAIIIVSMVVDPIQSYGVSGGIENIGSSPDNRPHRLFDINFDIFKF